MNVTDAIDGRHSTRAFLPRQVEREKLDAVLEAANHSPSCANTQPWEIFAVTGGTLERIKEGYRRKYESKAAADPETPMPAKWPEAAEKRIKQLSPDMARDCGDAVKQFASLNREMFNAPAVVYVCMDKMLSEWPLYDVGAYTQSFMLAALEYGLSTIPAITLVLYPDILRRELKIPENLKITIGIAIGYADSGNGINKFVSARKPLSETAQFFE